MPPLSKNFLSQMAAKCCTSKNLLYSLRKTVWLWPPQKRKKISLIKLVFCRVIMEHENSVKSEVDLESDSEPKLEIAEEQPHHSHMNTGKIECHIFIKT